MEIKTIAVMGAGAVGGYLIWGYAKKYGENLWVIGQGERGDRLKRDGLVINDCHFSLNVKTPEMARGVDLLFVTTKYDGLKASLEDIAAIADEHTIVISLLNGVDSEEIIAGRIGEEHLLYSVIKIASERKDNRIRFNGEKTMGIIYGEKGADKHTERVNAVASTFEGTSLHYTVSENIQYDIWAKYILNISRNLPQAILSTGAGALTDSEYISLISRRLREEVIDVAAAKGIDVSDQREDPKLNPFEKRARYSTLQDLDNKRHTEIEMFSGAMVRMVKELGVPVPYNEYTYLLIKALEQKGDGMFDYT